MERSLSDTESVLRLTSGMRQGGDHAGARTILEEAHQAVPGALEYVAAIAAMDEADGDYVSARDGYLRFLEAAGQTELSIVLGQRPSLLRGVTAGALGTQLVEGDRTLDHGLDPVLVMAVPKFRSPPGDTEAEAVAAMATELLIRDLRSRRFTVIDWELSEAVRQRLVSSTDDAEVPGAMARHLSARIIVEGDVVNAGTDSISVRLNVHRVDDRGGQLLSDTLRLGIAPYAPDRARLSTRIVEMASGAEEGTILTTELEVADFVSRTALSRFGAGLLLISADDAPGARTALSDALRLAPGYAPIQDRLDQVNSLAQARLSESLPFAEEILSFARSATQTRSAIRASDGAWATHGAFNRGGLGEVLGLDRVGAQLFLDILITTGGPS